MYVDMAEQLRRYSRGGRTSQAVRDATGLTVRGGLRVFQVNQTFDQTGNGVFNGGVSEVYGTSRGHGVTPEKTIEWQATPDKLLRAAIGRAA